MSTRDFQAPTCSPSRSTPHAKEPETLCHSPEVDSIGPLPRFTSRTPAVKSRSIEMKNFQAAIRAHTLRLMHRSYGSDDFPHPPSAIQVAGWDPAGLECCDEHQNHTGTARVALDELSWVILDNEKWEYEAQQLRRIGPVCGSRKNRLAKHHVPVPPVSRPSQPMNHVCKESARESLSFEESGNRECCRLRDGRTKTTIVFSMWQLIQIPQLFAIMDPPQIGKYAHIGFQVHGIKYTIECGQCSWNSSTKRPSDEGHHPKDDVTRTERQMELKMQVVDRAFGR
ncbi:hypothetical protein FIBSPDRAFT_891411 [Athelia psychrophila]|uniref:Uncharacterized protein n=1 Tax=Athelia psychrophila TaxID=1759441 RepID=A0A166JMF6_9AGAM|nr:hypothetical protein FIBSPDRAFT_891411 [Fibularhizoctonia sp. CBS 109695]